MASGGYAAVEVVEVNPGGGGGALRTLTSRLDRTAPGRVVDDVKAGNCRIIMGVAVLHGVEEREFRTCLVVDHGLVDALLNYVERSNASTWVEALPPTTASYTDQYPPVMLINALITYTTTGSLNTEAALEETRIKVARRLGPLVESMADLDRRLYFRDTARWFPACFNFLGLLGRLFESSRARAILLWGEEDDDDHGLLKFLVQVAFLDPHRPDVRRAFDRYWQNQSRDIGSITRRDIQQLRFTQYRAATLLVAATDHPEASPESVRLIGSLPAVSPRHSAGRHDGGGGDGGACFADGLLDVAAGLGPPAHSEGDRHLLRSLLNCAYNLSFALSLEELGEGAARKLVVDIGTNRAMIGTAPASGVDLHIVFRTLVAIVGFMQKDGAGDTERSSGTTTAAYVEEGLVEFVLQVLVEAERQQSASPQSSGNVLQILDVISHIMRFVSDYCTDPEGVSTTPGAKKALDARAASIYQELVRAESVLTDDTFKDVLSRISFVLSFVDDFGGGGDNDFVSSEGIADVNRRLCELIARGQGLLPNLPPRRVVSLCGIPLNDSGVYGDHARFVKDFYALYSTNSGWFSTPESREAVSVIAEAKVIDKAANDTVHFSMPHWLFPRGMIEGTMNNVPFFYKLNELVSLFSVKALLKLRPWTCHACSHRPATTFLTTYQGGGLFDPTPTMQTACPFLPCCEKPECGVKAQKEIQDRRKQYNQSLGPEDDQKARAANFQTQFCGNCHKGYKDGVALMVCVKCKQVAYCSKECQHAHREDHKPMCIDLEKHCANCFKKEDAGTKLKACSNCKKTKYCSKECQRVHWKEHHKRVCAALSGKK